MHWSLQHYMFPEAVSEEAWYLRIFLFQEQNHFFHGPRFRVIREASLQHIRASSNWWCTCSFKGGKGRQIKPDLIFILKEEMLGREQWSLSRTFRTRSPCKSSGSLGEHSLRAATQEHPLWPSANSKNSFRSCLTASKIIKQTEQSEASWDTGTSSKRPDRRAKLG